MTTNEYKTTGGWGWEMFESKTIPLIRAGGMLINIGEVKFIAPEGQIGWKDGSVTSVPTVRAMEIINHPAFADQEPDKEE